MIPSILARQLQQGIDDYVETTFPMTNEPFKGSIQKFLQNKGSLYHEPYVAVRLPFRVADEMPNCFEAIHPEYLPYVHQQIAFDRLAGGDERSTLVATGTGSGKTECFLYPILEYCYQHRGERGIKALIIYPMNALASDQAKRIAELIHGSSKLRGNVTVGMYVGGQGESPARMMSEHGVITDHDTMLNNPPDILMTNYKMLDYLLLRPKDSVLWQDNKPETLKYITVDELHTFDGAQGTDLACLIRRLKRRLGIYDGYLCCIGTSATMGTEDDNDDIIAYASEIFGEPFEKDAVITEDRLSPEEFFAGSEITEFSMPTEDQIMSLQQLINEDQPEEYLRMACKGWLPTFAEDVMTDEGRILLGDSLMHHSFLQTMIHLTGGNYYQSAGIAAELETHYPELRDRESAIVIIDSLFALISHARTGTAGALRPFLHVQVQLWMRELRRLVAKVDPAEVTYEIASDLNDQQAKQYLPVVNCRDCGITGWVSQLNERGDATMRYLGAFYNAFFQGDKSIAMMFPRREGELIPGMIPGRICPSCLHVVIGDEGEAECPSCGTEMIDILMPSSPKTSGSRNRKQYVCPCCGSRRGLSLMGMRGATEISASLSQMFSSKFNDDKKTLAFSDSVQDAAHRAGFFNARTWRFGLRTAIQQYCRDSGAGKSLADFQSRFLQYWHERMSDEEFVSFFIAPNMTWRHAYEDMIEHREFGHDKQADILMYEIEQRLKYEIMLEYGLTGKIGRTLEKSGCSVISFAMEDIETIAESVQERSINELGVLPEETIEDYQRMVAGFLNLMRMNGAFEDKVFDEYTTNDGHGYLLSNDRNRWLPGRQSGRNTPRFIAEQIGGGRKVYEFDPPYAKKYIDWILSCCRTVLVESSAINALSKIILEESVKQGVVTLVPSSPNYKVYGLKKDHVFISADVVLMRCETCGSMQAVSAENLQFWEGAGCQRANCPGKLQRDESLGLDYYGRLFQNGDLQRVNAKEHTGLLERPDREQLELDFKRSKSEKKIWDPNVLSCTPTLEMGIDIGDLSTVVLCSMPPAQSQFLQRAGRAGRKDGNALTLAIANAKPHDLYFYADPLDMISGHVVPPKIFLQASAVLERQFVAFCMDSWVKKGLPEGAIPERIGSILSKLDDRPEDMFPFNFMNYVQGTLSTLLNSFMQLFAAYLDDGSKEELRIFARGNGTEDSPMYLKILDAFESMRKQQNSLHKSIDSLKTITKDLENKPKDSSYEEEIKELKSEQMALVNVLREIAKKNTFNFLSDEGLLPNYAFPEAGIILKAILYRKQEEQATAGPARKRRYDKMVYEYSRSAAAAISEFAPNNSFYVDGRKLIIDQVDLTTAQAAKWRLCPNCSHAELEETGKHVAFCPNCGSTAWADAGQVRNMLRVQMVYSNADYTKSLIGDETEDRSNVFYCKQLLVDVDEEHDISKAYQMNNTDFPFGYEFVRKATLREINFGEEDTIGETMSVSGEERIRKGFKICKYCGKIQPGKDGKPNHTFACKAKRTPELMGPDAYEDSLFLYREFSTEILRLLVPATTMDSTSVKLESFVAAFMLGMKEYFGNVDHLRAAVSEVPVPGAEYRKQYLVIYDSVPGGTGYLKQLTHNQDALIEIFEKSLSVMENCSCKDSDKDGCYHCLYAYRQSRQIGSVSRAAAIRILKSILSGKDNVKEIKKIDDISVNPLFDSELEQRFIEAIRIKVGTSNVKDTMRNGKHSYYVTIGESTWEIEPQVLLGPESGVSISCKPDFIFWPITASGRRPVAVFTDGFTYHKDKVADDTLKRAAIQRSGKFRVWSLSYKDVQGVFTPQGDYMTQTLAAESMPSGGKMYVPTIRGKADEISPAKMSPMNLLMEYLSNTDAENLFRIHAYAYGLSLLVPSQMNNSLEYENWHNTIDQVNGQAHFIQVDFNFPGTVFGTWRPRKDNSHLAVYSGILAEHVQKKEHVAVCAILDDQKDHWTEKYEEEWNGMLQFSNLMQFNDTYMAVSQTGLDQAVYYTLPAVDTSAGSDQLSVQPDETAAAATGWSQIKELLFDEDAKAFAEVAAEHHLPVPEEEHIGYEVEGSNGEVIATIEIAWPEKKIGFLIEEQLEDKEKLESAGWRIIDLFGIADAMSLFGGES